MNILEEANKLVNGDRQETYGPPHENHERIAALWNAYLGGLPEDGLKPTAERCIEATDVALMMVLVKVARLMESPSHTDSYVDLAGYAQVAHCCAEVDYGTG